jgi:hypothetical protein
MTTGDFDFNRLTQRNAAPGAALPPVPQARGENHVRVIGSLEEMRAAYQALVSLSVIVGFLPYLYIFGCSWKAGHRASAVSGAAITSIAILCAIVPTAEITNVWLFEGKLAAAAHLLHALETAAPQVRHGGITESHPVANDPRIKASANRAPEALVRPADGFALLRAFRARHPQVPVGLLPYACLVMARGRDGGASVMIAPGSLSAIIRSTSVWLMVGSPGGCGGVPRAIARGLSERVVSFTSSASGARRLSRCPRASSRRSLQRNVVRSNRLRSSLAGVN